MNVENISAELCSASRDLRQMEGAPVSALERVEIRKLQIRQRWLISDLNAAFAREYAA